MKKKKRKIIHWCGFTWLQNMSVYSETQRGTFVMLFTTLHAGSTNNNMASRETEDFLASVMYS